MRSLLTFKGVFQHLFSNVSEHILLTGKVDIIYLQKEGKSSLTPALSIVTLPHLYNDNHQVCGFFLLKDRPTLVCDESVTFQFTRKRGFEYNSKATTR